MKIPVLLRLAWAAQRSEAREVFRIAPRRSDREQEVVELNSKVPVREQERPSVQKLLAYEKEVNEGFAKTA